MNNYEQVRKRADTVNSLDMDTVTSASHSLQKKIQTFGKRARRSIQQMASKSKQSPTDKRGISEILVNDRPNLKKEDFLSELEMD